MVNNFPIVSVVFTSYNHKKYLNQALDSLVNQTYPNLEIIIVDDCSTDGSQEILKQYEHYQNIELKLQPKNSGSYVKASNLGASYATGEYLLFAQCDDFAESNQIEFLIDSFKKNPSVGVVFSKSILIDKDGWIISDDAIGREKKFKDHINSNQLILGQQMQEFLSFSCVIPNLSAAIVKKELYDNINGLSDKYQVVADWEFWLKLSKLTDFYYRKESLNYFRQHSTTIRNTVKMGDQMKEIFEMFNLHIQKNNLAGRDYIMFHLGFGAICSAYLFSTKIISRSFWIIFSEMRKVCPNFIAFFILGTLKQTKEVMFRKWYLLKFGKDVK